MYNMHMTEPITSEKVREAIRRIVRIGQPKKIIVFGSYIHEELQPGSDLDILVISEDSILDTRAESVRIRKYLRDLMMPMDILVVRESDYEVLKNKPGLIYREIEETGKVVYEAGKWY